MECKQLSLSDLVACAVIPPAGRSLVLVLTISITMIALVSASGQSPSDAPAKDKQNLELIDLLLRQSYALTRQGKYDEALPPAERAAAAAREHPHSETTR